MIFSSTPTRMGWAGFCSIRTRLNFLICCGVSLEGLWDTVWVFVYSFTPFAIDVCTWGNYPFTLVNFFIFLCRCFWLLVVLSPCILCFHQLRSAAAAVCGDFDRRILLLASACFPSSAIWTPFARARAHTHTHTTLADLVFRCFEKYRIQTSRLSSFHPHPKLVSQRKDVCMYNILFTNDFYSLVHCI